MNAVPDDIRQTFLAALTPRTRHAAALPDPLPGGGVLFLVARPDDDESARILVGQGSEGWFLDYYVVRRTGFDEFSVHGRIHADGTVQKLENYEGQFGMPSPDDPAEAARQRRRISEHNARVREILRSKGFV